MGARVEAPHLTALASEPAVLRSEPRRDADLEGCEARVEVRVRVRVGVRVRVSRADAPDPTLEAALAHAPLGLSGEAESEVLARARSAFSAFSAAATSRLLVPPAVLAPGRQLSLERALDHVCAGGPPLGSPPPLHARHAPARSAEASAGAALVSALISEDVISAFISALSLKLRCGPSESHTPGPQLILRCWLVLVHDRSGGSAPTPG